MSTPTAPPAAPTPFASASLYVGDLAADVTEALLFEIFNAIGPVASVRVCRDAATRRSLGYAYVNFHRVEDAERALDSMNFTNIRNRPCRIMWSHRDPSLRKSGFGNIFVKNLAKSIDNKALYDTFSIFGNILSCKVAMNSKRESLGYGFVHYESDEAAANAIQRVNGMVIAGQKVNVAPFKSKKERGGADKTKYTNIYVKNLPEDATKEKLDELFSKYGVVTSSMIASGDDEKSRGFGFVNFGTAEEATAACEGLNGYEISPGKRLFVGRAQKKEEREKELRERFEQLKAERQKKYAGVNLYIKNLSDNIDKDRMIAEFSKFGQITSARVMQDEAQKSRGFGFVCYATPEEATKAVTEMNGKMVEGKPLYVALAQRKEVRRAQLEAQHARAKMGVVPPALYPGPQGGPMYFPPQGVHPRMMFPQPMNMPRRWNPSQGQPQPGGPQGGPQQRPQQMLGMPPYVNMGPMARAPVGRGGRGGRGGQQQGSQGKPGQGGRGGRGQGQNGGPNGVPNGQNPNPNFKYTQQVRNRDVQQNQPNQLNAPAAVQVPAQAGKGVLTIQELAAAPEEEQKQMIGERLFPLIQQHEPQLAGKITGMLLEMDNGELLHLLESQEALTEKINEALHVLKEVGQEGGSMVEQDA